MAAGVRAAVVAAAAAVDVAVVVAIPAACAVVDAATADVVAVCPMMADLTHSAPICTNVLTRLLNTVLPKDFAASSASMLCVISPVNALEVFPCQRINGCGQCSVSGALIAENFPLRSDASLLILLVSGSTQHERILVSDKPLLLECLNER